jgi:hypothetical protein
MQTGIRYTLRERNDALFARCFNGSLPPPNPTELADPRPETMQSHSIQVGGVRPELTSS